MDHNGESLRMFWLTVRVVGVFLIVFFLMMIAWVIAGRSAHARDLGQWNDVDPAIAHWYQALRQPDNGYSCCGEADSYEADEVHVIDGKMVAVVTDEREDAPLMRQHVPVGTRFLIPENKITRVDGNPTGHVIIFLGSVNWINGSADPAQRSVLCLVLNGGT